MIDRINQRSLGMSHIYLRCKGDIEMLVVKSDTPVLIRNIARVELIPDERRGLTELNGEGEVVSGIAMARYGQNALEVIANLKAKIAEIGPGLPEGVTVQTVYDRSELINRAIDTLNLDSSVERARVGCWRRVWVGATTLNASAFKEEQHPQTRRQLLNLVRSALTQEVNSIEATNFNVHNGLVKITSGQLRNLG